MCVSQIYECTLKYYIHVCMYKLSGYLINQISTRHFDNMNIAI